MGLNRFSPENKQKRVDLLRQLLSNNLGTNPNSDSLESLLSRLDLGSLEDAMQTNKKRHDNEWDSKKKRHHDDEWDSKKKHDHEDCGCKKKQHDHDNCGCKKKKHHHDGCGCKKKNRCTCDECVTQEFRVVINEICRLLNASTIDLTALKAALGELEELLLENKNCVDKEIAEDLLDLIDIIQAATSVSAIPPGTLEELGIQLNKLRRCLGLKVRVCGPGGGGDGEFECNCNPGQTIQILRDVVAVLDAIDTGGDVQKALNDLKTRLSNPPASRCVDPVLAGLIINFPPVTDQNEDTLVNLLVDLALCVALGIRIPPGQSVSQIRTAIENYIGVTIPVTPVTPVNPISTVRQRLLDLLTEQVAITTPSGVFAGTVVTVQTDYVAIVNATGTALIPFDQIQTFSTQ